MTSSSRSKSTYISLSDAFIFIYWLILQIHSIVDILESASRFCIGCSNLCIGDTFRRFLCDRRRLKFHVAIVMMMAAIGHSQVLFA